MNIVIRPETGADYSRSGKVNVYMDEKLAARYGIATISALLIFKDGQIVARHVGVTPEAMASGVNQGIKIR